MLHFIKKGFWHYARSLFCFPNSLFSKETYQSMMHKLINNLITPNQIQKDGAKVKSLLISEDVHLMLKSYCKTNKCKMQDLVEQAVLQYIKS